MSSERLNTFSSDKIFETTVLIKYNKLFSIDCSKKLMSKFVYKMKAIYPKKGFSSQIYFWYE